MFHIFTDTSSNLPSHYLRENNVSVIPYTFYVNGKENTCTETADFNGERFYEDMRAGVEVSTSQINPQNYIDSFQPYLEAGEDILFISMSSGISGSYNSSLIAKDTLSEEYPDRKIISVDTRAASLAEGISVMDAVELRDKGSSLEEIAAYLLDQVKNVYQVFTVEDLRYLRRTGRISNFTAAMGTLLNIHPLLKGNELGQIVNFAKVRGRKNSIKALAEKYAELVVEAGKQTVCIAHAGCREEADKLADMLRAIAAPKQMLIATYEPVTGSHVGPGTIALFFKGADDCRFR